MDMKGRRGERKEVKKDGKEKEEGDKVKERKMGNFLEQ